MEVRLCVLCCHCLAILKTNFTGTPYKGNLLFATEGRGEDRPPSLVLVSPYEPYNSTVLLNNFFGRQFNSLNDVVAVPGGDAVLFTDPSESPINVEHSAIR